MRTIKQLDVDVNEFSINFEKTDDDVLYLDSGSKLSVLNISKLIKDKHPNFYRGAIVYSENTFRNNIRKTSEILAKHFDKFRISWAVKSISLEYMVKVAAKEGIGFDVGSYEELELAKKANVAMNFIYHTAPAKYDWDINAIANKECVSISDNITELTLINDAAKVTGNKIKVGIRVNPVIESNTDSAIATGNINCKFGIPSVSPEFFIELKKLKNIEVSILQMHIGSQISSMSNYENAILSMVKTYKMFISNGFNIETIDIGGGFPYKYYPSDELNSTDSEHAWSNNVNYDFEKLISKISKLFKKEIKGVLPCIAIEPGRHLTAGTAFAVGYVLNTKIYPNNIQWVMTSLSVNDFWHKQIVPNTYYDINVLTGKKETQMLPSAVAGTLCFSNDILTPPCLAIDLPKGIQRNDVVFIKNVGAYSALGTGNFHNMPTLPIYIIDNDLKLVEIKKPKTV